MISILFQTDGVCLAGYVCCKREEPILTELLNSAELANNIRNTRQPIQVESIPLNDQSHQADHRCGVRHSNAVTGRIRTSGQLSGETQLGEYPWHAAILKREEFDNLYVCGGSLIDTKHVLTAAHCLDKHSLQDLR